MKKKPSLPTSVGVTRWGATLALLTVLALAAMYLAKSPAMAAGGTRAAAPDFAAIDAYVEREMQAQRIPGLALAIVQGDRIVHLKGFGEADPSGRAVTPQTPFMLGSTTKSFTALAVMQLVEAGRVDLDAPVQRYIPWFRAANEAASAQITVRNLLNQTSGFSTAAGRQGLMEFDTSPEALENRVRRLGQVELSQPVGATYQYSNCNYQVLGLIVQMVSGQAYESYVQQHILGPLDMRNSFTSKEEARQHGLAVGHRAWFGLPVAFDEPFPRGNVPSGFIISSAEDMARYLSAYLNEGRVGDVSILSPAGIAELHRPAVRQGDSDTFYGMGWNAGPIAGLPAVWHDGDTFSFHSFMVLVPGERWGVMVLANANNIPATARFQTIVPGVINLLAGRQPTSDHVYDSLIVHGIVVGIIVLQIIGMIRSGMIIRRWRSQPQRRSVGWLRGVWIIGVPFALNLLWALVILVVLPQIFAPLPGLMMGIPDVGYMLVLSGLVALGWSILRTVLVYFALRRSGAASAARTPATA